MANPYLFTVTFEHVNGFAEDRVVNTFPITWTLGGAPTVADFDAAFAALSSFYNDANSSGDQLHEYISSEISRTANVHTMRAYDIFGSLDGSPHGSPVDEFPFSLGAPAGGTALPSEVAIVMTTRANGWQTAQVETPDGIDPGTAVDRPRQRLSGRIFIGPLHIGAVTLTTNIARVTSGLITDILDAGDRLDSLLDAASWQWGVWSRVNQAVQPVTHLQVDNAFDTMRRRGADPTVRTTRVL